MFHILILNDYGNNWSILMGLVANKILNSDYLFHVYNFYIILITTPSEPHYFGLPNADIPGKSTWSYLTFLD